MHIVKKALVFNKKIWVALLIAALCLMFVSGRNSSKSKIAFLRTTPQPYRGINFENLEFFLIDIALDEETLSSRILTEYGPPDKISKGSARGRVLTYGDTEIVILRGQSDAMSFVSIDKPTSLLKKNLQKAIDWSDGVLRKFKKQNNYNKTLQR